jgi:hypothetical protein
MEYINIVLNVIKDMFSGFQYSPGGVILCPFDVESWMYWGYSLIAVLIVLHTAYTLYPDIQLYAAEKANHMEEYDAAVKLKREIEIAEQIKASAAFRKANRASTASDAVKSHPLAKHLT